MNQVTLENCVRFIVSSPVNQIIEHHLHHVRWGRSVPIRNYQDSQSWAVQLAERLLMQCQFYNIYSLAQLKGPCIHASEKDGLTILTFTVSAPYN